MTVLLSILHAIDLSLPVCQGFELGVVVGDEVAPLDLAKSVAH